MKFNIDIGIYNINRSNPTLMDDILCIALSQAAIWKLLTTGTPQTRD